MHAKLLYVTALYLSPSSVKVSAFLNSSKATLKFSKDKEILIGEQARRQLVLNPKNTFYNLKRFIGSEWDELDEVVDLFRDAGVDYPVWIMPVGAREEEQVEIIIEDDFMAAARIEELEVRTQIGTVIIAGDREIREEDLIALPYRMKASNYIVFSEDLEQFEEQYIIRTSWSISQAAINRDGEKFEVHFEIRDLVNDRNIHSRKN